MGDVLRWCGAKGVGVARYVDRDRHDWLGTVGKLAVFVGIVLVALLVVYPERGFLPTFLLILAGLWTYVSLMAHHSGYVCTSCHKVFRVPTSVNFFSTSSVGKNADGTYYSYKLLTCPHCAQRTKARLVKRAAATATPRGGPRS